MHEVIERIVRPLITLRRDGSQAKPAAAVGSIAPPKKIERRPVSLDDDDFGFESEAQERPKRHPWKIRVDSRNVRHPSCMQRRSRDLIYIGTICRGIQLGDLAVNKEGRYVQVNGDWIQILPAKSIRNALQALTPYEQRQIEAIIRAGRAQQDAVHRAQATVRVETRTKKIRSLVVPT